ncbi:MAG TPA: hypothetical protein VFD89_09880 [Clostridia bacterium]|nr:hypothetical protein [Clostridia bacterium]
MVRFFALIKGELLRLARYKLFAASIFVSMMWVGVLHFVDMENVTGLIPQLVFMDVTTMAVLLVGVTFIYERDEATLYSMLISPITKSEYILAKLVSHTTPGIVSLSIMYIYALAFKTVDINYFLLLGGTVLVAFFHSQIGFLLTYYSRDFTDLVMYIIAYFLVSILPVILDEFAIITNAVFKKLVFLIPTKAALMIIVGTTGVIESWKIALAVTYIIIGSVLLHYLIWRKLHRHFLRGGGE